LSQAIQSPIHNRILAALPTAEYERLQKHLTPVSLPLGETLYQPEEKITEVYFVNTGVISFVATLKDGGSVEVGLLGNDSMIGLSIVLGDDLSPNHAIVQIADGALRMKASALREELKSDGQLLGLLLRSTLAND
jgi:CRP-like cAMP-binding protein